MNLEYHVAASIPLAGGVYALTGSSEMAAGVIAGGILIDTDHFMEFWHDNGFSLDIKNFFVYGNSGKCTRLFIIFHSFELLLLMGLFADWTPFSGFLYGLIIGAIPHILMDYINLVRRLNYRWYSLALYFFIFRLLKRFDRKAIDVVMRLPKNIEVSDGTGSF